MPVVNFRPFILLAFVMALVVAASNYLVQFPFDFFGLEEFLTYGAFSYPVTFLITDLCNRKYGKILARKIVYVGFISGISLTLFFFPLILGCCFLLRWGGFSSYAVVFPLSTPRVHALPTANSLFRCGFENKC